MVTFTVHIPIELASLLDGVRGERTRNRYITDLLAAQLGVTSPARPPGRPYKGESHEQAASRAVRELVGVIARDDDDYRRDYHARVHRMSDAATALGLDGPTPDMIRAMFLDHMTAWPAYHPPGTY